MTKEIQSDHISGMSDHYSFVRATGWPGFETTAVKFGTKISISLSLIFLFFRARRSSIYHKPSTIVKRATVATIKEEVIIAKYLK